MNITDYSKNRIIKTFSDWEVSQCFASPMYTYLVYGYHPGSFFYAVLANNFATAIMSSHPANTVDAFKSLVGWMSNTMPDEAYGSHTKIDVWSDMSAEKRRHILEKNRLVYTEKEEVIMILKNEPIRRYVLY